MEAVFVLIIECIWNHTWIELGDQFLYAKVTRTWEWKTCVVTVIVDIACMNHVIILCNDHDNGSFFRLKRKWVNGIYVTFRKGNFFCLFVYLAINNIRLNRRVSLRLVPVTPFIPIVQPFMRATLWRLVLGIFFTQLKTWDLLRGILTERLQLTFKSVSST